jgi:hypothetical protein
MRRAKKAKQKTASLFVSRPGDPIPLVGQEPLKPPWGEFRRNHSRTDNYRTDQHVEHGKAHVFNCHSSLYYIHKKRPFTPLQRWRTRHELLPKVARDPTPSLTIRASAR